MNYTYIFGHKEPDTDSIASAIGYATFLNKSEPGSFIAASCGALNPETKYVLSRFGIPKPEFISSVEPKLSDITYKPVFAQEQDVPTVDIATQMAKEGIRNVVITDSLGKPVGIIGEHALARAYIEKVHLAELAVTPIAVETLARILEARIIVSAHETLEGRVYIAIDALHVTLGKMTKKDIAVVGDNEPAQLALISAGIACLIIAGGAPVGERLAKAAEKQVVSVLATDLDAFIVGRMINLSLPAGEIMEKNVPVLTLSDSVIYARKVVSGSKFRAACVVSEEGKLAGVLTRTTLLNDVRKSVILLDHNEASQAVNGILEADVVEIIDHHRIAPVTTLKPIKFLNDPVGATSTIIAMKYRESGIIPSKSIAGLLLSGILSDTLALRMSTTTQKDIKTVEYLVEISGEDPDELGISLLKEGMALSEFSLHDLLTRDKKEFDLQGLKVIISQVMTPSFSWNRERNEEIKEEMSKILSDKGVSLFITLFTNVLENSSEIYGVGYTELTKELFGEEMPVRFEGVMSRKKDFLPWLGKKIREIEVSHP